MASDGGGATDRGTSTSVVESQNTAADTDVNSGPDANPNEPGHQDASDAGDKAEGPESKKAEDTDVNSGPDANPNEPGHQDASDAGDAPETAEAG